MNEPGGRLPVNRAPWWKRSSMMSALISGSALVVAIAHAVEPDLKIDMITLGLLGIAVVPWLGHIITSIELPGGVKVTYREWQELQQKIAAQEVRIEQNQGAVQSAVARAQVASVVAQNVRSAMPGGESLTSQESQSETLMEQYDSIRNTYKAGSQRTALMTEVVGKMIAIAPGVQKLDLRDALFSMGGRRLAAYAQLYAMPDAGFLSELIRSLAETVRRDPIAFVPSHSSSIGGSLHLATSLLM